MDRAIFLIIMLTVYKSTVFMPIKSKEAPYPLVWLEKQTQSGYETGIKKFLDKYVKRHYNKFIFHTDAYCNYGRWKSDRLLC